MKVVVDIPDKYLFRWNDLRENAGYSDMDSFIISAIGIGVQTIYQATTVLRSDQNTKVVQFDKNYYWK